jgi:hypothetical protein
VHTFLGKQGFKSSSLGAIRVARWYVFKPKIPIGINFGESCNGTSWYILCPFGIPIVELFGLFYGHLVFLWSFGHVLSVLVSCINKNLATLGASVLSRKASV